MNLAKQILKPSFWDRFGVFYFIIIISIGVWMLLGEVPKGISYLLIIMGLSGFIVDFSIVYKTYLKRKLK